MSKPTGPRVLIVDDEPNIRFIIERSLQREGYQLTSASDGAEALKIMATSPQPFDLVLLDLRMEPIGGIELLQNIPQYDEDTVAIILTAHGSMESAVEALRLGAFDYLFKPTTPEIIRQRVKAGLHKRKEVLQRRRLFGQLIQLRDTLNSIGEEFEMPDLANEPTRFAHAGGLVIDRHHRQASLGDELLDLTTTEFDLLLELCLASPTPVHPRILVNNALGYDCEDSEARDIIKWHIYQLRRKIEPIPSTPVYIKTVRHKGYLWSDEE